MKKPVIGITMGDPAGIGPELCLRILNDPNIVAKCIPVVFGDLNVMKHVGQTAGITATFSEVPIEIWSSDPIIEGPTLINCKCLENKAVKPGIVQAACGKAAWTYIKTAVDAALEGKIDAIATAPIHKTALKMAGKLHTGHTETIAKMTKTENFCMMMASAEIKVSLVTSHVPIEDVPKLMTEQRVLNTIELTYNFLKRLGITDPRIAVCSLNPHGGESGLLGSEESSAIRPAIDEATRKMINIEGPLPPDSAFVTSKRSSVDAYIAMYHDQGLIPFKMLTFSEGVNITLGLPIIRTSVDHGTAFDIAWRGTATASSLVQAILWACRLTESSGKKKIRKSALLR